MVTENDPLLWPDDLPLWSLVKDNPPPCPWSPNMTRPPHVHGHSKWPPSMSMVIPGNIVTQNIVLLYPWSPEMTTLYVHVQPRWPPPCPWSFQMTLQSLPPTVIGYSRWLPYMCKIVHGHPTWPSSMSMVNQNDPPVCPWSLKMTPLYVHVQPRWPPPCPWSLQITPQYVHGHSRWPPSMSLVAPDDFQLCRWSLKRLLCCCPNVWDGSSNE